MARILLALACCTLVLGGCASGNAPREDQKPQAEAGLDADGLEPIGGDGKKVCGWSDTGRWECSGPGKKKSQKVLTKFKKGTPPPPPKENNLPRGDTPVTLDPIDDDLGN